MAERRTSTPANKPPAKTDGQRSTLELQTYEQVRDNGLRRWFDEKAESRQLNQLYKWANPSILDDKP